MSRAKRVILAGHTGLEKAQIASKLRGFLESAEQNLVNRVGVYDFEEAIRLTRGGDPRLFAGITGGLAQRERWRTAWNYVQEEMKGRSHDCCIVHLHLVFAKRGHRICPGPLSVLAEWHPDMIIVLIDDVFGVKRRIQLKNFDFSFTQLYDWRTTEQMLADQLALTSSFLQERAESLTTGRRGAICDSVVVAVKHPLRMLGRMILDRALPRVYASFPITSTRESLEKRTEIDRFRCRLHELFVTFDPLTIEELVLVLEQRRRAPDRDSFDPTHDAEGNPKGLGDQRWSCRLADCGDYEPMVWEPESSVNHLGKPELFYPLHFPQNELNELWAQEAGEATSIVHDQVTHRDLRLVDQADFVVCYRPYWDRRRTSGGVTAEVTHANQIGKPVFAYVGDDMQDARPLTGSFTHQFTDQRAFWEFLQQKASERIPLPRALYY